MLQWCQVRIFISHASEQSDIAQGIETALNAEGHTVFLDRSDLPPGETYNNQIRKAIAQSGLFIFLVSPEAVASGRYSITEIEFAKDKWRDPSDHVLPVMVKPTDLGSVPAYVKAVTILEPQGNVPAAVAAAVAGLNKPRWRSARVGVGAMLVMVLCASALWWSARHQALAAEVSTLLESGRLQQQSGRYPEAWDTYIRADSLSPGIPNVARAQEELAMAWLDDISVTVGQGTFTAIVQKVEPVLVRCAVSKDSRQGADCQAHLGWGDFLRMREGAGGLDPGKQYRRALERDPGNVYAHTMLAFNIVISEGSLELARPHFDAALASGRERTYVRHLEFAALLWQHDRIAEDEAIRVANEMRKKQESMPDAGAGRADRWRLWNVYYDRLINREGLEPFLEAMPAADHLATFRWLFPETEVPENKHNLYLFMLGTLEEHSGERATALATFRILRDRLSGEGALASGGPLGDRTVAAVKRLSN
jgi:tetratricopeptide (TPR) repeat protein